ncbi:MotA/TolQ/ExbB proton channel family protein [Cerasicoccus fimbriatus]|uniref:MotA/TolQ/ExbB proton channel family protein n=1 Tax=Cerasicoccus fimbriatus TaxID=3014554 RepID=UPI0022B30AA5|nr:MotA/TolQ/ExbB proton channel family protein [Cerasicoccus sp. TK19100]
MRYFLLFLLALLAPIYLGADEIADAAQADLKSAIERLRKQRADIAVEKAALLKQYNALEAKVREQRRNYEMLKLTAGQQGADYEQRRTELVELEQQFASLQTALEDYRIYLQTNLHPADAKAFMEELGSEPIDDDQAAKQAPAYLNFGLQSLQEASGGRVLQGEAAGPNGQISAGQFLLWGPMSYFSNGSVAGFSMHEEGLTPQVAAFNNPAHITSLSKAMAGEPTSLPLDASNGRALLLVQESEDIADHLASGGVWVWPILTLAGLALLVMFYKIGEIGIVRLPGDAEFENVLSDLAANKLDEAKEQINKMRDPAKSLLSSALDRLGQPREVLEDVLLEHVIRWQMRWERGLAMLAVTAAVSPLLGLLGTVTGMISTFRMIGVYGSGEARPMAGGISEALVTTELGLLVAIPALIAHAILSRRAQSLTSDLEGVATRFIDALPGEPKKESADG